MILIPFSVQESVAQRVFGVRWEIPDNTRQAIEELRQFREMGVTVIEVNTQPEVRVWRELNNLQFEVFGTLNIKFPVASTFAEPDSSLLTHIERNASSYLAKPSLKALGVFKHGAVQRTEFREAVAPYLSQLRQAGTEVYFIANRNITKGAVKADFYMLNIDMAPGDLSSLKLANDPSIGAYLYSPRGELKYLLSPLRYLLEETSANPEKPLFLHSEWLFNILETHPEFQNTLQALATHPDAVFPVPHENLPEPGRSILPIIILILAWGIIALLYHSSPIYRKSVIRYFAAHKFFIKDIFSRQIRSPMPAMTIILLNTLLISACTFAAFQALLSPLGREAFLFYFPLAPATPTSAFVFILTFIAILLLTLISILWLFLSHPEVRSLTQILIIYAWPLQLNFISTTIAITLFSAEAPPYWIALFTLFSYIILLLSFPLASLDAAKYIRKKPVLYLLLTSGIYLLILIGLAGWAITGDRWWEITDLLLSLR